MTDEIMLKNYVRLAQRVKQNCAATMAGSDIDQLAHAALEMMNYINDLKAAHRREVEYSSDLCSQLQAQIGETAEADADHDRFIQKEYSPLFVHAAELEAKLAQLNKERDEFPAIKEHATYVQGLEAKVKELEHFQEAWRVEIEIKKQLQKELHEEYMNVEAWRDVIREKNKKIDELWNERNALQDQLNFAREQISVENDDKQVRLRQVEKERAELEQKGKQLCCMAGNLLMTLHNAKRALVGASCECLGWKHDVGKALIEVDQAIGVHTEAQSEYQKK